MEEVKIVSMEDVYKLALQLLVSKATNVSMEAASQSNVQTMIHADLTLLVLMGYAN